MGIRQLMKFICDHAPQAVTSHALPHYLSRKVAIDASMSLYQLLIAVRQGADQDWLKNTEGETTSHIQGMFYRTLKLLEVGIKPAFVFDGSAPDAKREELNKRKAAQADVKAQIKEAQEAEQVDQEAINKLERKSVRVTPEQNEDVKKLLRLMGIPVVESPGEAEAQCAAMAKAGVVYAVGTEDMDALTFGTPRLLRSILSSSTRTQGKDAVSKAASAAANAGAAGVASNYGKGGKSVSINNPNNHIITEINLEKMLQQTKLSMSEFIDLCILMGCDYCSTIKGLGQMNAYKMITQHRSIEAALPEIKESKKFSIPENFNYKEAKRLFEEPLVSDCSRMELKWQDPDEAGLIQFLCDEKGFSKERVQAGLLRMKKSKSTASQQRMDSFFTVKPQEPKDPKDVKPKIDAKGSKKHAISGSSKAKPPAKKQKK